MQHKLLTALLISLLFTSLNLQKRVHATNQGFKAGVIAQTSYFDAQITVLGSFSMCRVISAKKQDEIRSACYIKVIESNWVLESFGAQCEVHCSQLDSFNKTHNVVFNPLQ
ncbi:hypothetical protein J8L98_18225 [Pseudoalteromonas sp. MMG013]|uniref:hypothetical protein n=1 Tax=Pseudoalteromonas sp. MMG013 TaxID=2822687 RepID=UPI001B37AC56|nr:hypothetical protein [Pseudoalteromonas sp. MMG013]MBQ4863622.1 hypothetical protein [Pseudoalteromonas sp. MMG013]